MAIVPRIGPGLDSLFDEALAVLDEAFKESVGAMA